jgi:hypothetical protein
MNPESTDGRPTVLNNAVDRQNPGLHGPVCWNLDGYVLFH